MVEHGHHAGVTTFVVEHEVTVGEVSLDEMAAHHAQVKRLAVGNPVAVTDGRGHRGSGRIASLSRQTLVATIETVDSLPAPPPIHLFLPVADRDRMLWLAEKTAELQITSWNPVMYRRSMGVSPRGEGEAFDRRVHAKMVAALEQSGGAWLPEIRPVCGPSAIRHTGVTGRFVLDAEGPPLNLEPGSATEVSLAIGPEGGFEAVELATLVDAGWTMASIGDATLRFETAAIAAVAVARVMLANRKP